MTEHIAPQKGRGFRTDYESHTGLLHTFARKIYGRLCSTGVTADYDDVFGDVCEAYSRAAISYNPAHGVGFGAYLGRAIYNNVNKIAERRIRERTELGMQPLSTYAAYGEEDETVMDRVADVTEFGPSPEELLEAKQDALQRIDRLPELARTVVAELTNPSEAVKRTHQAMKAQRAQAVAAGYRTARRVSDEVTLPVIFQHFGLTREQISMFQRECREYLGVDLRTRAA